MAPTACAAAAIDASGSPLPVARRLCCPCSDSQHSCFILSALLYRTMRIFNTVPAVASSAAMPNGGPSTCCAATGPRSRVTADAPGPWRCPLQADSRGACSGVAGSPPQNSLHEGMVRGQPRRRRRGRKLAVFATVNPLQRLETAHIHGKSRPLEWEVQQGLPHGTSRLQGQLLVLDIQQYPGYRYWAPLHCR